MNNTKLLVENWRTYLNENEVLNEEENVVIDTLKALATAGIIGALILAAGEYGDKKRVESLKNHPEIAKHVNPNKENAMLTKTKDGKNILTIMREDGSTHTEKIE